MLNLRVGVGILLLLASALAAADPTTGSANSPASLPASKSSAAIVSLADALAAVAAGDEDVKVLEGNLQSARAQHQLNLSKNLPNLSGNGGYAITDGFNDQAQAIKAGATGGGIGQSLSGGLSYAQGTATATSGTRMGLTLTQSNPYSPLNQTLSSGATIKVNSPPSTAVALTLSQAVWDGYLGGQTKALVDKSALAVQKSELTAKQSRSAASAKAKQAYIAALVAQRTLALRLQILDKQNSLLKQIEATFAIKQASAIDLMTARINSRSAELDVETSRHDFALARQRLANVMGLASDSSFQVAEIDLQNLPAASLEEALAKGLTTRVDLVQLDLTKRSALIDANLARGSAQPAVTATGGIGLSYNWGADSLSAVSPTSVPAANGESISLGLRVSMPILDGGAAKAQENLANASVTVASIQAAQLADSVAADIRDAWWTLTILAEKIDLAKQSVDLAEAQLALVRQQVQFGTATNQDLLTAAVNSANAQAALLSSKSNQLLGVLALETAMGL